MNYVDDEFVKIRKDFALRMYDFGYDVFVIPCKVKFDFYAFWVKPFLIPKNRNFYNVVEEYEFYNCNHNLGMYCSFYVSKRNYNEYLGR